MSDQEYLAPVLVQDGQPIGLSRLRHGEHGRSERWLQELLFKHPSLVPAEAFEPNFTRMRPLAMEVPTPRGRLDLLFINDTGHLTLVETKLWRNPEARRTVVAQIVDYAECFASWTYDELREAVVKARGVAGGVRDPLIEAVCSDPDDFDESKFIDSVSRNLRLGRFVLLIIGDGIREGVEQLAEFLNQTPQLQFRLGLIELAMYRLNDDAKSMFVQPRLLAKTREVTRAIVEINYSHKPDVKVQVPNQSPETKSATGRSVITEAEFLEELQAASPPEVASFIRWVFEQAVARDLKLRWATNGPFIEYEHEDTGDRFTFGKLNKVGTFATTGHLSSQCPKHGLSPAIYEAYLNTVAAFFNGAERKRLNSPKHSWVTVCIDNSPKKGLPLVELAKHGKAWFTAIDRAVEKIDEEMAARENEI